MSHPVNLIGNPLSRSAREQINSRVFLKSQKNLSDVALTYKGKGHNAFVKLTSFVDILDSALATAVHEGVGTDLARKWSLYNGVNTGNGSAYNLKDKSRGGVDLYGYGQGGTEELGVRPMPGIISIDIQPAGTAGSVRQATVKFKCHNLAQLDIMDVLYFRFGFSMLLEWGNTIYPTNNESVTIADNPVDCFRKQGWTKEDLLKELSNRREVTYGNYDAMLGLVTNYEWIATADGGYDCTLHLVGIGAIIESLKINGTDSMPGSKSSVAAPLTPATATQIRTADQLTVLGLAAPQTVVSFDSALATGLNAIKSKALELPSPTDFQAFIGEIFRPGLDLANTPTAVAGYEYGFNPGVMSGRHTINKVDFSKVYTYHVQTFNGASGDLNFAYVPLSLILAYINNSCTAYNQSGKSKSPLVYIDFHPNTNYCFRLPDQFSLDPGICLVDNVDIDSVAYTKWMETKIGTGNLTKMNPGIPSTRVSTDVVGTKILEKVVDSLIDRYQDSEVDTRGRFMNILVNIDFVISTLSNIATADDKVNVALSTFLDKMMQEIARATGNINKFEVSYDDESNVVRIYDNQLTFNENSSYPTLPIFGLDSVVRSLTVKTETSTRIGSMLAIEAMAAERTPSTDGSDGSAFAALNSRLTDRLLPLKSRKASDTDSEGMVEKASTFASFRYQLYEMLQYKIEDIQSNINFYNSCMNAMKSNIDKTAYGTSAVVPDSTTAKGILPLSINITMDGISNIRLREGFTIPADRLPSQYKNGDEVRVGFVIAGLSHSVQNNSWITTIRGQMVNIPSQKTTKSGTISVTRNKSNTAGKSAGTTTTASGCKTSYPKLPIIQSVTQNILPYTTAASYLKTHHPTVARPVFAILFAEASKEGEAFRSAGAFNYAGVQTDAGVWGVSGFFTAQYCRRDSERLRMFAGFENDGKFLDFMASRVKAKGFGGAKTGDQWTSLYINTWWSPEAKTSYVKGTKTYNDKLAIYNSAMKRYV